MIKKLFQLIFSSVKDRRITTLEFIGGLFFALTVGLIVYSLLILLWGAIGAFLVINGFALDSFVMQKNVFNSVMSIITWLIPFSIITYSYKVLLSKRK